MSHKNKRQHHRKGHGGGGPSLAGPPFGSISLNTGQPGQPGSKQPGVSWALNAVPAAPGYNPQASISALPGAYPFWQQLPSVQPGQPGQSGIPGQPGGVQGQPGQSGGYLPPPRLQKHGKHESIARGPLPPGKRQRFQSESRQPGQPGTPGSAVAPHPAVLGLQGFPGGGGGGGGSGGPALDVPQHPLAGPNQSSFHPGTPGVIAPTPVTAQGGVPFTSSARPPWVLDSPARAHFPHSSLSFPLPSPGPRATHFNKESISYTSKPSGPNSGRRVPGPPPKAILGGPGGRTFDELKVTPTPTRSTSLEVSPNISRRSSFGVSSNASTEGSPLKAPSTLDPNETLEIKHMGNTVRISLPPGKYSPPDTPVDIPDEDPEAEAAEASVDGAESSSQPPAPRIPRKHAFPWPAPQVRISPTGIPLPLSPTEADLDDVEDALDIGDESPVKLAKTATANGDAEAPSLVPSWTNKEVVISVPSLSGWHKLRPTRAGFVEPDKFIDMQNERDEMDLDLNSSSGSGHTSPFGSTTWATAVDESVPGMSPPAFTALQEPWPPTRSGTPSDDDGPGISPIEEGVEKEVMDDHSDSDTDTATPPPVNGSAEDPSTAASIPLPTNPPNTAASPGIETPPLPPPIPPNSAASRPPSPTAEPSNDTSEASAAIEDPPLTAIPPDSAARFPGIDSESPAPSPTGRRTFGINPFLKRSLGGMLRDTPRTRSAASSEAATSRLSSPVTTTFKKDATEDAAKPDETAQTELLPGDEADEEDNAAESGANKADVASEDVKPEEPAPAEAPAEDVAPQTEAAETAVPTPKADGVVELAKTDTDPSSPLSPPVSASTRTRRPVGAFANAAFRRQVQGFIPSNAVAFKPEPSPRVSEFSKREREASDDEAEVDKKDDEEPTKESPATVPVAVEEAAPSHPPSLLFDGVASALIDTPSPPSRIVKVKDVSPSASPATTVVATEAAERLRSPSKDQPATKRLKPTATPFIPKPTAAPFVPRATAAMFSPPKPVPSSPPKLLQSKAVHSPEAPVATLAPLSFAPISFEPKAAMQPRYSLAALLSKSPSGLRPTALPFVPGGGLSFGSPTKEPQAGGSDGNNSLGLFTFTAKLRPSAAEYKPVSEIKPEYKPSPRQGPNGTPYRPPPLDLSRSEPASRAFELLDTSFQENAAAQDPQPDTAASDIMARRHSFKESSDIKRKKAFHDSGSVDLARRHSFKASADLQPWRNEASPRSDDTRSEHSISEMAAVDEAADDARESPRRRTHTAKRSSQNSYLSRNMLSKSTPSSPIKSPIKDSPSVRIVRSRPIRNRGSSGGSRSWVSPESDNLEALSERLEHLPMPTSADEFSPIAPVPSEIDAMSDATGPSDALLESVLEREMSNTRDASREQSQSQSHDLTREAAQISAGLSTFGGNATGHHIRDSFGASKALNPAAPAFVFGGPASSSQTFTVKSPTAATTRVAEARPPSPTAPAIQVELADENKFRQWIFPTGSTPDGTSRAPSRAGVHIHKHSSASANGLGSPAVGAQTLAAGEDLEAEASASEINEEEVEWRTWRRQPDEGALSPESPRLHSSNTSAEFPMRSDPPRVLTVVNGGATGAAHRSLLPLSPEPQPSIAGREDSSEILDVLQRIQQQLALLSMDTDTRSKDAESRAKEAHKQTIVATEALDLIKDYIPKRGALDSITRMLDMQAEVLDDIQRKIEENDSVSDPDRTLVVPEPPTNAMIKAVLSSQNAMMDKFSDFAEAQEAIYDLRSATDALLEAQTDVREIKADRAQAILQTQALNEVQKQLREETNKNRKTEKEIASLRAKLDEANKRAKEREMEDMWRNVLRSDMAAATASLAKVAKSEEHAREELSAMRELMAKQAAEQTAAMEQLRAERDAMAMLAEERNAEITRVQTESSAFKQRILDRFDMFETTLQAGDKERVVSLEKNVTQLRSELSESVATNAGLRVQLTQALADVQLEREKSIRSGDEEAGSRRNIDLQLKGEKARGSFLENKVAKLETELHDVNQNLDVWRSAALEQRLRSEQSAVQIAAMQQENYHWREFALGADRHRLEQWLATKPFHEGVGVAQPQQQPQQQQHASSSGRNTPTNNVSPTRQPRAQASARANNGTTYPQQGGSPLKHAISIPAIVVPSQ